MTLPDKNFWLKKAQAGFFLSPKRYVAMVGGWGTGKTMMAILKCLRFCEQYENSLVLIARREYTDLRDSTIQDFQRYTTFKINEQHKEIHLRNNSKIIFRHADEFNALQNINLSMFFIEQADEIEDQNIFDFLRGRLRRGQFQQGIITANATDTNHWIYKRFKERRLPDYELFEMSTFENSDVLPAEFINDLKKLKTENIAMYEKYVLNHWGIEDNQFTLIKMSEINMLENYNIVYPFTKKVIAIDPSGGGDECVAMFFDTYSMKDMLILHEKNTMKVVGHCLLFSKKHNCTNFAVDIIGLGKGVADRLAEMGMKVIALNSSEKSSSPQYYNKRAEMYCYVASLIRDKQVSPINDEETRKQLSSIRYDPKAITSQGGIKIEAKQDIKKRLGRSPDRADCYVYGIYALQYVDPEIVQKSVYSIDFDPIPTGSSWSA